MAKELLVCSSLQPRAMRRHLAAAHPAIQRASAERLRSCREQALLLLPDARDGTPRLVQLLLQAFSMLHLGVQTNTAAAAGPSSRPTAAAGWTDADVDGVDTLLVVISACLTASGQSLKRTSASVGGGLGGAEAASSHQAVALIGAAAPCAALVAALGRSLACNAMHSHAVGFRVISVAIQLLQLATPSPPLADVLVPDLHSTRLFDIICDSLSTLIAHPSAAAATSTCATATLIQLLETTCILAAQDPQAQSRLAQLLFHTPPWGSLVLDSFKLWGNDPLPSATLAMMHAVHLALWRLRSPSAQDCEDSSWGSTQASLLVTAHQVASFVHATTRRRDFVDLAEQTLALMWEQLHVGQQSRAFAPIAMFARRIIHAAHGCLDVGVALHAPTEPQPSARGLRRRAAVLTARPTHRLPSAKPWQSQGCTCCSLCTERWPSCAAA